jgi:hypothetical protein
MVVVIRWDEKADLLRDAIRCQVVDALEAQEIKETGNETLHSGCIEEPNCTRIPPKIGVPTDSMLL